MITLTKENFDSTVADCPKLLLFFHSDNAASIIQKSNIEEVDRLHGKDFEVCTVDALAQQEILAAFSIKDFPANIAMADWKIVSQSCGIVSAKNLLELFRKKKHTEYHTKYQTE